MLTNTEAKAKALAMVLKNEPTSFGADEAKTCLTAITKLNKAGELGDDDADECRVFFGNHSAVRQWAVKHGFIVSPADALSNAVSEAIAALKEREADEMAKLAEKKK